MKDFSHYILVLALSMVLWNNAIANTPCVESKDVKPITSPKHWYGKTLQVPIPFFLNRSPANFYQQPLDKQSIKPAPNYPLGTLFFAVAGSDEKQPNRLRVGLYSDMDQCFTALPGWIDKSSLIQEIKALRVGDAVRAYPQLGADQDRSCMDTANTKSQPIPQKTASHRKEMTCDNRLFLRALSRPEFDFKPRKHPVDGDIISEFSLGVLKHLWRYVYAIEEFEGQLWYLLGNSSNLTVKRHIIETDANTSKDAQYTLLGWIPKYQVTEWATNVALEYNTDSQALTGRFNDNKPAPIYNKQREDAQVLAVETLSLAQPAVRYGSKDDNLQVRFDPFGLDPMLARYYVKGFNEKTGWYKVATIGTSKLTLSDEQMRAIMTKLRHIIDDLRAVDLVFVVDRSDSMTNVITEVRTFLDDLCQLISEKRRESNFVIKTAGGGKSISTSLDIRVSMVAYAEESETIFSNLKLPEDREEIHRQMDFALEGTNENMYGALHKVITDSQSIYWRKHALRAILLLTDEPGTHQGSSQLVKSALDKALEKPAQLLTEMGEDSSKLDSWDYTPIWSIFTSLKKSILFRRFKSNLTELTYPQRIIDLHVKADGEEAQITKQRKQLREQIYQTIGNLQNSINGRLRLLANRLTVATSSDKADKAAKIAQVDSNTLISQAGLEAAFKQHGITAEDISAINALAFVEGYANKQYSYHSYPTFREVIVIETRDLNILHNRIDIFVSELNNAFTRFSVCDPKAAMAAALFQALAQVSGNENWLQKLENLNTREQCQYARNWLMGRELENQTIAELIGIADILPVSDDGLLAMEKRDFRRMSPNKMGRVHNILAYKVVCMNNILRGRTVPSDVKSCQRHRSSPKNWDYTPVGSTNHYIYLPRHLVP